MAQLTKIKNRGNLAQLSYQMIKNAIISMDIKPGQPLLEEKLVKQLGISRTPLRAALSKLAHEELVNIYPGRGTYVAELSYKDMVDTLSVREALERLSASLAVKNRKEGWRELMSQLEHLLCEQKKWDHSNRGEDMVKFLEYDNCFHIAISELANNEVLTKQIISLKGKFNRFVILSKSIEQRAKDVTNEHRRILESLLEGDPEKAEDAMSSHIIAVRNGIEEGIRKHLS